MPSRRIWQGEIWWYQPPPGLDKVHGVQHGERPVLILSNDTFNHDSNVVNCIPLSAVGKHSPVHVLLDRKNASRVKRRQKGLLLHSSYALCEQVLTVSQQYLTNHMGSVTYAEWCKIKQALQFQFSWV